MFNSRTLAAVAALTLAPLAGHASTFDLDFGVTSQPDFNTTGIMDFAGAAPGINARLTSDNTFASDTPSNNGSVSNDIRINMSAGESETFTLSLFDESVGDGYTALYDPGVTFTWDLVFYDIDGSNTFYDEVAILTGGTYTITNSSTMGISPTVGGVNFSGQGTGNIPGQGGLNPPLTQAQADVTAIFSFENKNQIRFTYSVTSPRNARNLLIDGGSINLDGFPTTTTPITNVPLPAGGVLLIAGLGGLALTRKARKV